MTVAPLEQMQLFCAEFQLAPIQLSAGSVVTKDVPVDAKVIGTTKIIRP